MGTIATSDNAGVFLRRVDKSQVPAALAPNVLYGAFAINSERGFTNQVYTTESSYLREKSFGKKDYRKYNTSAHDLDKFLESKNPAYVVRAGSDSNFKLAGFSLLYDASPASNTMTDEQYATAAAMITAQAYSTGDVFRCTSANDTTDNALETAKGSAPTSGDCFLVTSATTISFVVNQASSGVVASLVWSAGKNQSALETFTGNEFAHVFANGEGTWANGDGGIEIVITPYTLAEYPDGIYQSGDTLRISKVEVYFENVLKETFDVSMRATDVDNTGASIYIADKFAGSDYASIMVDETLTSEYQVQTNGSTYQLMAGGAEGSVTSTDFLNAINLVLAYPNAYDTFLAVNAGCEIDHSDFNTAVAANGRCFGISGAKKVDALCKNISSTEWVSTRSSSYSTGSCATSAAAYKYNGNNFLCTLFNQWVLTLENESGQDIYISPCGYAAYAIGVQSANGQLPYAPAGYRRAELIGAKGISRNFTPTQRLDLVEGQWNPIKSDRFGTNFWSQLTTQTYKSAYSNTHVALSYLAQMRGIENTLRGFEFEFNDQDTIDQIIALLQDLGDLYVREKYAEQIVVDAKFNTIGSDQILIRWNVRYKEVAKTIVVDVIAYPSTQDIEISIAEVG